MKPTYGSYCGLYCGACGTLMATERGEIDVPEKRCMGCKSELVARGCLEKCLMRPCAMKKELDSCGECSQFPCEILLGFQRDGIAHHEAVVRNLKSLADLGKEAWLDAQRTRWTCACGERFSWKQEVCARCGERVRNSLREADQQRR